MKAKLSILAGFLVSAALLWLAFRNVDFARLAAIYSGVNAVYLLPFAAVAVLELFLRGVRWRLLLLPSGKVRVLDAFRLQAAGLALNNILPMRLGELARATFAARLFEIPLVTVLATILVERLLDIVVLFLMFALAAWLGGITGGFMHYGAALWALVAAIAAGIGALIFADELVAHRWFSGFFARFPRVRGLFEKIAMGVRGFHSFKSGALIFGVAFLQWSLDVLNYLIMARAFGLQAVLDVYKSVALLFTGAVAASVPGMPGYFGNFEFALSRVLMGWGVAEDLAFAYTSYAHVAGYLAVTLTGVIVIYTMGHSLGRVWSDFTGRGGEAK